MDFPGDPVVKNLPANAEDMGLISALEKFHMPRGNKAQTPQLMRPVDSRARAWHQENPPHKACAPQVESGPFFATRESLRIATKNQLKIKK